MTIHRRGDVDKGTVVNLDLQLLNGKIVNGRALKTLPVVSKAPSQKPCAGP